MDVTRIIFHRTDQSIHIKRGPLIQRKYRPTLESYTRILRTLDTAQDKGLLALYIHADHMPPGWTAMLGEDEKDYEQ